MALTRDDIQIRLSKSHDHVRVVRLVHGPSGTSLTAKIEPKSSVLHAVRALILELEKVVPAEFHSR